MSSLAPNSGSSNARADWNTVEPLGVYKPLTARSRSPFIQPLGMRSLAVLQPQLFSSDAMSGRLADEFGIDDTNAGPDDVDAMGLGPSQLEGEFGIEDTNIGPNASPLRDAISTTATTQTTSIQRQTQASDPSSTLPDATGAGPMRSQSPVQPQSPNSSQTSNTAAIFSADPPATSTSAPQVSEAIPTNSASESIQPQRTQEASQPFATPSSIENITSTPETKTSQAPASAPTFAIGASPTIQSPATSSTSETIQRQAITETSAIAPSTDTASSPSAASAIPESRVFVPSETTSVSTPANVAPQRASTQAKIPPHENSSVTLANDSRSTSDRPSLPPSDLTADPDGGALQRSPTQEPTETTPAAPKTTPLQRQAITPGLPTTESTDSINRASVQANEAAISSSSSAESVQPRVALGPSQTAAPSLDTSPADGSPSAASPTEVIQATASVSGTFDPNAPSSLPTSTSSLENSLATTQPIARSLDKDAEKPFDQADNITSEVVQDAVGPRASDQSSTMSGDRSAGITSTPVTVSHQAAGTGNREQGIRNREQGEVRSQESGVREASESSSVQRKSTQDTSASGTPESIDILSSAASLQRATAPTTNATTAIAASLAPDSTDSQTNTPVSDFEGSVPDSSTTPTLQQRVIPETTIAESPQTDILLQSRTDLETPRSTSPAEAPAAPSTAPPLQRTASPDAIAADSPPTAISRSDSLFQHGNSTETITPASISEAPTATSTNQPLQRTVSAATNLPELREQSPETSSDLVETLQPTSLVEQEAALAETPMSPVPSSTSSGQPSRQAQQINRTSQTTPSASPEARAIESIVPDLAPQSAAASAVSALSKPASPTDVLPTEPSSPSANTTVQRATSLTSILPAPTPSSSNTLAAAVNTPAIDPATERPFLSNNRTVQGAVALPQVTQDLGVFTPLRSPLDLNAPADTPTPATERIPNATAPSIPDTAIAVNQATPNSVQAWSTLEDLVQQSPVADIPEASGNAIQRQKITADTAHEGASDRATPIPSEQPTPNLPPSAASTSSPDAWDSIADLLEQSTPPDSADAIDRAAISGADAINRVATSGSDADTIDRAVTSSLHAIAPASATPAPFPNLHALDTPPPPIQRQTSLSQFTGSSAVSRWIGNDDEP
ncbi:MAG: hypothetical protein AAFQ89_14090, partial [Cyanobacteria bacterium J06626_18]